MHRKTADTNNETTEKATKPFVSVKSRNLVGMTNLFITTRVLWMCELSQMHMCDWSWGIRGAVFGKIIHTRFVAKLMNINWNGLAN